MSAGLWRRCPARLRTLAAMKLPRYPITPASASTHRWVGERGSGGAVSGAPAGLGGDEVAQVPDNAGEREHPQVGGWTLVDEAENRLDPRHARADEDGRNDEQSRLALGSLRTHQEGDSQGNCGERVPEVVELG